MEDDRLPTLREDAEEEQAQRDLEQGCREDVEYFAQLDILCRSVAGRVRLLEQRTTRLKYRSSLLNNVPPALRIVMVKMKAQYVVNSSYFGQYMLTINWKRLTRVATMAASSQPCDLVIRKRTHNLSPTASHAQMTSVMDKANTTLPSVISSWMLAVEAIV